MKKRICALLAGFVLACAPTVGRCMLTEEEQLYYRLKKEREQAASEAGTATEKETEKQTQAQAGAKPGKGAEKATEKETEKQTQAQAGAKPAKGAEKATEKETEKQTQAQAGAKPAKGTEKATEKETEKQTQAQAGAKPGKDAEKATETETKRETLESTEMETEADAEGESETELESETETESESETESETESEVESETAVSPDPDAPLVAIDPGHAGPDQDMSGEDPNGPGSDVMRARMTPGTKGVATGLAEYELNLDVCLQLKKELLARGYRVLLTRETHDVSLSDIERCQMANEAGADIFIHIHGNTTDDASVKGALVTAPSYENPYVADHYNSSMKLADDLLDTYCEVTGLDNRGIYLSDNLTSINWSEVPVTILEMGYMSNEQDDRFMADPDNQKTMVEGIADGIDKYFARGGA